MVKENGAFVVENDINVVYVYYKGDGTLLMQARILPGANVINTCELAENLCAAYKKYFKALGF